MHHPSPPLAALAVVHTALFGASLAAFALLSGGGHIPSPFQPGSLADLARQGTALRWSALFLFGSAVPLGLFAATAASRLRFLGVRAAGVDIALFGGIGASLALTASGLALWAMSDPLLADSSGGSRALQLASFAAGGPAFAVGFGLLAAGVSVTGGLSRLLPRWLMWFGLAIAAAGELSTFRLVFQPAAFLLPLTRFPGLVWLIATGLGLPKSAKETP
jgi:hypothetical protein